jgi:hypothetical protein
MRRRRSRRSLSTGALALVTALAGAGGARVSWAQGRLATEGALFLLLPVGARAVGMGQAVMGDEPGSEAVWWNPAALARQERREAAIHHSQSIFGTGDAVSIVLPSSLLGVLTVSVGILDYGAQENVDPSQGSLGTFSPRSLVYAASYATSVGDHLNAGVTYKIVEYGCAGACPSALALSGSTSALDLGAQYDLAPLAPVSVGAALRNIGPRLQVNDRDQSDPLPTRLQVGALYRVPGVTHFASHTEVHVTGDAIGEVPFTNPALRVGADLIFRKLVHLRGGYVFESSDNSGASMGFGISSGNVVVDLARTFQGLSADAGQAPTYVSLRYLF